MTLWTTSPGSARRISPDRKSTRLNSSHVRISYAVFCLKKKKKSNASCCAELEWLLVLDLGDLFDFFFFNDTATTEIYTLSLHDALPIPARRISSPRAFPAAGANSIRLNTCRDRKSTRLNSSHVRISYAVFCLKKKN